MYMSIFLPVSERGSKIIFAERDIFGMQGIGEGVKAGEYFEIGFFVVRCTYRRAERG